jgi:hypothetical protein
VKRHLRDRFQARDNKGGSILIKTDPLQSSSTLIASRHCNSLVQHYFNHHPAAKICDFLLMTLCFGMVVAASTSVALVKTNKLYTKIISLNQERRSIYGFLQRENYEAAGRLLRK